MERGRARDMQPVLGGTGDLLPPQARRPKRRNASYDSLVMGAEPEGVSLQDPAAEPEQKVEEPLSMRSCLMREPLLMATVVGVVCGVTLGLLLKLADPSLQTIKLIGFPGELMLRLLKMLVLPLVAVSMVSGVCSLQQSGGQGVMRLTRLTFTYYTVSTLAAILLGILLVQLIQPGRNAPFDSLASASEGCHPPAAGHPGQQKEAPGSAAPTLSTVEALMGVGREVVPDNIVAAAVNMNILGIITFSLMFGIALSSMGPAADGIIKAIGVLNAAVSKMVTAALWVSPLGIGSLIAASILRACDLLGTLSALGLWALTVVLGLALFSVVLLPMALYLTTGLSPLRVTAGFAQALLMAFGTSSSAASLPLAMKAARQQGCEDATVSFFLPLGTTVNMNGTALYEATTAIFIAQAHGVHLGAAELLVVAFTASLAAVGAPAIPSAGLVTMLIVLQAVNLGQFAPDLAVILAVDWLLDRIRTTVNLQSDAYGCLMVDHLLQRSKWQEGGAVDGSDAGGGSWLGRYELAREEERGRSGERGRVERAVPAGAPHGGSSGLLGGQGLTGYVPLQEMHERA